MVAKSAIRTQLASIKATGEATKANADELLQRAHGKIPQKRSDQTAAERKRELEEALASVPALRAERKQMRALELQEAKASKCSNKRRANRQAATESDACGNGTQNSVEHNGMCLACEEPCQELLGGVCAERLMCLYVVLLL